MSGYNDMFIHVTLHGAIVCGVPMCNLCCYHLQGSCRRGAKCTYHFQDEQLGWICTIWTKDAKSEFDIRWEHILKHIQLGLRMDELLLSIFN